MVLNSLVVSLIPVAILSLQVFHGRDGDVESNGGGDCDYNGDSGSGGDDNGGTDRHWYGSRQFL